MLRYVLGCRLKVQEICWCLPGMVDTKEAVWLAWVA